MSAYKARPDRKQRELEAWSRAFAAIAIACALWLAYLIGQPGPLWCIGDACSSPRTVVHDPHPVHPKPTPRPHQDA